MKQIVPYWQRIQTIKYESGFLGFSIPVYFFGGEGFEKIACGQRQMQMINMRAIVAMTKESVPDSSSF